MDRPAKEVLARMRLAEAVLLLWRWVTCEERMQGLWDRYRGRCYEKIISFSLMVHLIADALLQYEGSGRRSFEKNIENGQLETSLQAAYGKLGRLPIPLSEAFLAECTAGLTEAFPPWAEWELPNSLRGLRVVVLDGKAIKRVAKRLKWLRGIPGGLLGGRALVATEKLFDDVERQLIAWNVMFEPQVTIDYFQRLPDAEGLRSRLKALLGSVWSDTWLKSPPQQRHGKTPRKRARTHSSVYRILRAHCRGKPKQAPRGP
jgi:hypothetical protein